MPNNLLRQPNFAALVMLVWLVVALALLLQFWTQTAETLLGSDDAMRLVEMRGWLAGPGPFSGWFDTHQARLNPPVGYDSHWSRLIDAGLAVLLLLFQLVDAQSAERLMRAWWPLLWLLPTIAGMAAIAWRVAGREAATVALLLALLGVPAYAQFTPGRIDHHNVQIALTLLVVAAVAWSDRKRWTAGAAGALTGLSLAIGFESLPYLAVCGGALALRHMFVRDAGRPLRDYGLALAASAAAGFLVSVAPDHWNAGQCDAIAINSAAAMVCAGLVLALAGWLAHESALTRVLAMFGACSLSVAALLLLEPRCVQGPFALVDPGVWQVWHDQMRELQPLSAVFQVNPLTAAGIAAFPAAALLSVLALAKESRTWRDFGFLVTAAVFVAAAAVTVAAVRGYSHAMWLGMPLVAAVALRVFAAFGAERLAPRIATAALLTPLAISSGAITVALANGLNDAEGPAGPSARHCIQTASYARLAGLPPGLVVADASYGPFVLALTPHAVMAAPYHRLGSGTVAAQRVLAAPPDEARAILKDIKANYVVTCDAKPPAGVAEPALGASLWGRLRVGVVPGWLEKVDETGALVVYRIKS